MPTSDRAHPTLRTAPSEASPASEAPEPAGSEPSASPAPAAPAHAAPAHAAPDWSADFNAHRSALLKYARLQLRNDAWAEDAVSETLLAALEKPREFAGRSQLRTWLVGILKHKLVDQIRRHCKEMSGSGGDDDQAPVEDLLFDSTGHWREPPAAWGHEPDAALHQVEFMQVLEACVTRLPPQQGRVFMMKEWLELEADEICREAGVSMANFWVLLHRARLRLRECLQQHWFADGALRA